MEVCIFVQWTSIELLYCCHKPSHFGLWSLVQCFGYDCRTHVFIVIRMQIITHRPWLKGLVREGVWHIDICALN